jgi:hypothetical protein
MTRCRWSCKRGRIDDHACGRALVSEPITTWGHALVGENTTTREDMTMCGHVFADQYRTTCGRVFADKCMTIRGPVLVGEVMTITCGNGFAHQCATTSTFGHVLMGNTWPRYPIHDRTTNDNMKMNSSHHWIVFSGSNLQVNHKTENAIINATEGLRNTGSITTLKYTHRQVEPTSCKQNVDFDNPSSEMTGLKI